MIRPQFYSHYGSDPFFNMAFDEWMFGQALKAPGTLHFRLYSWQPGAITVGYNQKFEQAVDHSRVGDTAVIRRVTGGRALYHDPSEITYSVAIGETGAGTLVRCGSVAAVSKMIAQALVSFLGTVGIDAQLVRRSSERGAGQEFFHKAPCFASFSRYEIASQGRKVVASAQRQIGGTIFQHGSIKISGVASHPALPLPAVGSGQPVEFEPLLEETFSNLKNSFKVAFESLLGAPILESVIDPVKQQEVRQRCCYVRKYFGMRRDIL